MLPAGSLRGGGESMHPAEGQAAEAIAAIRQAREQLGQGHVLEGVSGASINSGAWPGFLWCVHAKTAFEGPRCIRLPFHLVWPATALLLPA